MIRLLGGGVFGLALLVLWIYCIFDVISSDEALVRNLPKMVWLVIVVFIPTIGSVAWLALGRPPYASWRPGGEEPRRPPRRVLGPEDFPGFPTSRPSISEESAGREERLRSWEEDLRRREDDLRRDDDGPVPPDSAH